MSSQAPGEYLLVSGLISPTLGTASLDAVYQFDDAVAQPLPTPGDYDLELWDGGTLLATYPFAAASDSHLPATQDPLAAFTLLVPHITGVTHIALTSGADTLVTRTVTAHTPVANLDFSPSGGVLTGTLSVTWTATDEDGDDLVYALFYSHDDGETWQPLIFDHAATVFDLDTTLLAGSDQARLRILASDGFNTTSATSAAFRVAPKGPQWVTIVAPEDAGVYAPSAVPRLQGGAWDQEDGMLDGASLVWTDSAGGKLGTGEDFYVKLAPGGHTITLTATDSDSMSASVRVSVQIGWSVYLPLVRRDNTAR